MAHQARSCLVVHYRVLDREMVARRLAHGDQEETQPRAGDPDERDEIDGSKTWWPSAHLLESMNPREILQSDPSAVLVHHVEVQGVIGIHWDRALQNSSGVISGRCADMSISITPTTGVDSNGKASEKGWIGMLKRCTRATMLGGPLKNAKVWWWPSLWNTLCIV